MPRRATVKCLCVSLWFSTYARQLENTRVFCKRTDKTPVTQGGVSGEFIGQKEAERQEGADKTCPQIYRGVKNLRLANHGDLDAHLVYHRGNAENKGP